MTENVVRRQNWMHFTFINCTSTTPCIRLKPQHSSTAAQLHCTLHSYSTTWHGASFGTAPPILQDQVLRHLQDQEQQLPDHIPTLFKDQDRDRFLQELLQWLQHNPRHQISNYSKIKNSFLNMLNLGKIFLYKNHNLPTPLQQLGTRTHHTVLLWYIGASFSVTLPRIGRH